MAKLPSIRAVAAAAGVSPATVSRALNEHPQIAPEERARIQGVAAQMRYRKNALISSVMRDFRAARGRIHRGTLAFLTCDPEEDWGPTSPAWFVPGFLQGVRARASAQGYGVEVFLIDHPAAMPSRRLAQVLTSRGISGALLSTAARLREEIDFPWDRFASVAIGSFYFRPRLHRVGRDFYRDVHATLERLWSLGYRRIGFATHEQELRRQDAMGLAAYMQATAQLPLVRRPPPYRVAVPEARDFVAWARKHRLDAVMCEFAEGLDWLRAAGLAVPEDIGFANLTARGAPDVSGLSIPYAEIGGAAVDLLTKLIEQREIGIPGCARAVQVRSGWQEGSTLRP